jgi:hypothetical protein
MDWDFWRIFILHAAPPILVGDALLITVLLTMKRPKYRKLTDDELRGQLRLVTRPAMSSQIHGDRKS